MNSILSHAIDPNQMLRRNDVQNTLPKAVFDDLLQLAAHLCAAPIAIVTLVDDEHHCAQASIGLSPSEGTRARAFHDRKIKNTLLHIVPDTQTDPAWANSPLVLGETPIRFYADFPLRSAAGMVVGQLTLMDTNPHTLTSAQIDMLTVLARQIASQVTLREHCHTLEAELAERAHDRAALQQMNQELRTSEERFRLLANATNDAIWDWNLHTNHIWWSEGVETLFGFVPSEMESTITWWRNRIHPADQQRVITDIYRAIDAGDIAWSQEYRFLRKDGSFAHVLDRGYVIHDAAGNPLRMVGGMTDITASKLAETQLREQAALLDKAQDAIWVRDLDHRITYWNNSAEQLYGWRATEAKGRSIKELLYTDDGDFYRATRQVLETGEWIGELAQITKHGQPLIIENRWTLVHDDLGNPHAILAINTNITERKKLEAQFLRAQRLESIGTLAGGIAHDLNNALAPILLSMTLLKQRAQTADDLTHLDRLEASVQRGADMVRQILSFARGVKGQHIPLQVGDIVKEIEKLVCDTFNPNIRTLIAIDPHLWSMAGDPTQIHQVLLNLCVNARDAMPNGGQLQISAANVVLDARYVGTDAQTKSGCYIMVNVADRGSGIPAAIREQIFDPFFTTKKTGKGTGMGLSAVQAIVKNHGGFINLHSAEGRGTIFKIYFPVLEGVPVNDAVIIVTQPPRGHRELVLVVDDDATVRMITQQTLEAFGYQVLIAEDGAEAVARYVQHSSAIAAILLDMMMPVMDGMATIETLLQINPQVKIIASSGLAINGIVAKAAKTGVTHFLQKPYTAETLLKTLALVLAP